jgi:hypothetical protein
MATTPPAPTATSPTPNIFFKSLAVAGKPQNNQNNLLQSNYNDLNLQSLGLPPLSSNPFGKAFNEGPSAALSSSLNIPDLSGMSSTPIGNGSAQNSQQNATQTQSNITSAFNAVQSLYDPMGGRPIAGSEDVKVKVDAYGRPFTTVSMTPTGSGGYESAADKANTNRLGQFQAKQVESQASSQAAASTPAAIQSEQNRQALIQSKISSIPQGASTTETQTPNGTNRMVSGSSGYAEALIPKKKQGMV